MLMYVCMCVCVCVCVCVRVRACVRAVDVFTYLWKVLVKLICKRAPFNWFEETSIFYKLIFQTNPNTFQVHTI